MVRRLLYEGIAGELYNRENFNSIMNNIFSKEELDYTFNKKSKYSYLNVKDMSIDENNGVYRIKEVTIVHCNHYKNNVRIIAYGDQDKIEKIAKEIIENKKKY